MKIEHTRYRVMQACWFTLEIDNNNQLCKCALDNIINLVIGQSNYKAKIVIFMLLKLVRLINECTSDLLAEWLQLGKTIPYRFLHIPLENSTSGSCYTYS